jgi:hypothetical protein
VAGGLKVIDSGRTEPDIPQGAAGGAQEVAAARIELSEEDVLLPAIVCRECEASFPPRPAAGPPGVSRTVQFGEGETDKGLNLLRPIVVEGELVVIRHPARGQFPAVVELQVREARRVR